jgi:hypothetical protein
LSPAASAGGGDKPPPYGNGQNQASAATVPVT